MTKFAPVAVAVTTMIGATCAHAVNWKCTLNGAEVNRDHGGSFTGKTGVMKCADQDQKGKIVFEQEYRSGKAIGRVVQHDYEGNRVEGSVNAQGNREGAEKKIAPSGKLVEEALYQNGQRIGVTKRFWPNGAPQSVESWSTESSSNPDFKVEYHDNGKISDASCTVRKPLFELERKICGHEGASNISVFDAKGRKGRLLMFVKGEKRDDKWLADDGSVSRQETREGERRTIKEFWPGGKMKSEVSYRGREKDGVEAKYAESGVVVEKSAWSGGALLSSETFYLNGQPKTRLERKAAGKDWRENQSEFSDNGQLVFSGSFVEKPGGYGSKPVGVHKRYFESGQLVQEDTYDDEGRLTGTSTSYYQNGKLGSESTYEKGVLKRRKSWDKDGAVTEDDEYFPDGSRKSRAKK